MTFFLLTIFLSGCSGSKGGGEDYGDLNTEEVQQLEQDFIEENENVPDENEFIDVQIDETQEQAQEDIIEVDLPFDVGEEEETTGNVDRYGTNNQTIENVERVIFLGDSITATPYLVTPWSDLIRDSLKSLFGASLEFQNYAAWGARTEDVRDDQLPRIDTGSTKRTLVLMTVGGNDALQVLGESAETSLSHMQNKVGILEEIIQWIMDPSHFPGGVYLVFGNIYDPTDGVGDFTHCGIGTSYQDWPELSEVEPVVNGWYMELANRYGVDMLDMHGLFLGHGYHNNDTSNPWYCHDCSPDCPCPRWFDFTCIHPNADGHEALAGFFYQMVVR